MSCALRGISLKILQYVKSVAYILAKLAFSSFMEFQIMILLASKIPLSLRHGKETNWHIQVFHSSQVSTQSYLQLF